MKVQQAALPYCGAAPLPVELAARWNFDPLLLAALAAVLVLGWTGNVRRAPLLAAVGIAFVLFVSPFCALASALFSARVTHHVVLTGIVAPLVAMALPRTARSHVALWTLAHAAIFWAWHAPAAYALALSDDGAYWLMQASLLGSAIELWRAIRAAPPTTAIAGLLGTMMQMGMLGALLTFAATPLYAWHFATTAPWGFTPLADQQLAGLIMWVPGAGAYLAAAICLANRWFVQRQQLAAA